MTAAAVTIRRLKLSPRWSAAPAREALQRGWSDIHLARYGLPAQAIVVVRRLQVPGSAFQTAHTDPLAGAVRSAVRPAFEAALGAGVAAVWFADEAELLVCMARDVLADELAARWWWPLLLARTATPASALQRWVAAPQAVPWALHALAANGQGAAWLTHIGPAGRVAMVRSLARTYPVCEEVLAGLLAGVLRPGGRAAGGPVGVAVEGHAEGRPDRGAAGDVIRPASRGAALAQPAAADAVQPLLRLAEVLRVAPERAASADLLVGLRAIVEAGQARAEVDVHDVAQGLASNNARDGAGVAWLNQAPAQAARPPAGGGPHDHAWAAAVVPVEGCGANATNAANAVNAADATNATNASQAAQPHNAAALAHPPTAPAPRRLARPAAAHGTPIRHLGSHFHTRFGGLAFLLNVALHLGLYGDFTQPLHPGLPLSPWRLLHTALAAAGGRAGRGDALGQWLRERAGGAAEPRVGLPWQLPASALRAFEGDTRRWHALVDVQALQLWHPAGFCVAQGQPADGLQALLAGLQRPQQAVAVHTVSGTRPVPRLSALIWPLLRARLALGLDLPARAALALCLPLRAQVQVRSERLDLHFSLETLPLALRLAGLDRDPGWLPAAGSDIRFHFD